MEKERPCCGRPSDRGRLKNRTKRVVYARKKANHSISDGYRFLPDIAALEGGFASALRLISWNLIYTQQSSSIHIMCVIGNSVGCHCLFILLTARHLCGLDLPKYTLGVGLWEMVKLRLGDLLPRVHVEIHSVTQRTENHRCSGCFSSMSTNWQNQSTLITVSIQTAADA